MKFITTILISSFIFLLLNSTKAQEIEIEDGTLRLTDSGILMHDLVSGSLGHISSITTSLGDIKIQPSTFNPGILEITSHTGIQTNSPLAPLYIKQVDTDASAFLGLGIESSDGTGKWSIGVSEADNKLEFFYNAVRRVTISTTGVYTNVSPLLSDDQPQKSKLDKSIARQELEINQLKREVEKLRKVMNELLNK